MHSDLAAVLTEHTETDDGKEYCKTKEQEGDSMTEDAPRPFEAGSTRGAPTQREGQRNHCPARHDKNEDGEERVPVRCDNHQCQKCEAERKDEQGNDDPEQCGEREPGDAPGGMQNAHRGALAMMT